MTCWNATPACGLIPAPPAAAATTWKPCDGPCRFCAVISSGQKWPAWSKENDPRVTRLGAFLRRERIYSSIIANWRKQVGVADQAALAPKRRGPKPDVSARHIQRLERDNARLRHKLGRAELIIDAQKKLCVALGLPTADEPSGDE